MPGKKKIKVYCPDPGRMLLSMPYEICKKSLIGRNEVGTLFSYF